MVNTSLNPISASQFAEPEARHLLSRAGFGGTAAQVKALVGMGLNRAVDHLVDYESIATDGLPQPESDPDLIVPATGMQRQMMREARRQQDRQMLAKLQEQRQQQRQTDRSQFQRIQRWWLSLLVSTPCPLQEKLTLLWHGHFATNYRTVRDSHLMYQQNQFLRHGAAGSFATLARGIVRDPAMLRFLDNNANRRGKPNENLARELMELFTLGEGQYSESDIKEGARALTGYTFVDNEFQFARRRHDPGVKMIFGLRGRFDGDDFVGLCLKQEACPRFVAFKLYDHFVGDLVYEHLDQQFQATAVIRSLGGLLKRFDYRIKPVLKRLFRSQHFYDSSVVGNKIKSPAQLVAGTVRALQLPIGDLDALVDAMRLMGQSLLDPPSVAGWSGGRSWINASTLFVRQNLCTFLLTGRRPGQESFDTGLLDHVPAFQPDHLAADTPHAIVDHWVKHLIAAPVPAWQRQHLVEFLERRPIGPDAIAGLLLLITAMPEYQLC